jgi:hypothetical protein
MLFTSNAPNLLKILSVLKIKAFRKKEWYTALSFEERVLTELVIKHIKIVKNPTLATVIARIIVKLTYRLKNSYFFGIERIGRPIAMFMSEKAFAYGNKDALNWMKDKNYIRYLGLISYSSLRSGF